MEITIGKYIHRSVDDEVLTVMKKDKEIYRMNIREVEITFYHPDTTLSRVASLYFVAPGMNSAYLCINRKDNGEIRILHDYLMDHGAKENFMGVMKAGMAQHTSDLQKKQEEKFAVLSGILTVWTRRKISTMHFLCLHMLSII